jgi:Leucine rich repeat N-terminal domain
VGLEESADPLLMLEFFLKDAFVGEVLKPNVANHYGPLHVEWMDDPTNCRNDLFSEYVQVSPITDPVVVSSTSGVFDDSHYCAGDVYLPAPLPQTRAPTSTPSVSPSLSLAPSTPPTGTPSISPSTPPTGMPSDSPSAMPTGSPTSAPTYDSVALTQLEALFLFYKSTEMDSSYSSALQNWFTIRDYCNFTGVLCDSSGYVIGIDLYEKGLAGRFPESWENLNRLLLLEVVGNQIEGPIPANLVQLDQLKTINLSRNRFTGAIPSDLRRVKNLQHLLLQNNKFNGTIHAGLCELTNLTAFNVANNVGMTGEIPPCFGDLPLEIFRVDNNGLVGQVPANLCGDRTMNDFSRNPYGCDAVACPAGTYGIASVRQLDNVTECKVCLTPSNVIGSTTCVTVNGNTVVAPPPAFVSMAPSTSSSFSSAAPSSAPMAKVVTNATTAPTAFWSNNTFAKNVTNATTVPSTSPVAASQAPSILPISRIPSISPSKAPKVDSVPSAAPSNAPSGIGTVITRQEIETMSLTIVFVGQTTTLVDLKGFVVATKAFLTTNSTTIYAVRVLSQVVQEYLATDSAVLSVFNRRLEPLALLVKIELEGSTRNGTLVDAVEGGLTGFDVYVTKLGLLPEENVDEPLVIIPTPPTSAPTGSRASPNLGLICAAVALSAVAVASIFGVYRSRISQEAKYAITEVPTPDGTFADENLDHVFRYHSTAEF